MHPPPRVRAALRPLLAATAILAAAGCGGGGAPDGGAGGPLSGDGPYLTRAEGRVRTIVVTANAAQMQSGASATCTLQGYLFDATSPRSLDVQGAMGECVLYSGSSDLALASQSWVCAGSIAAAYAGREERLTACRDPGDPLRPEVPIACEGLTAGATVRVFSPAGEIDGDVVGDLDASATMPGAVAISQPTGLGVTTWPEAGDLEVRWTSADATSAVVTVHVQNATGPAPVLVCQPRTNGQVTVPRELLIQGNFRAQDAVLRVASYRDVTTTAEMGLSYRVAVGSSAAVLLQARR